MKLVKLVLVLLCVCFSSQDVLKHKPEQGKFKRTLTEKTSRVYASKTLYNQSSISIMLNAMDTKVCKSTHSVKVHWFAFGTHCKGYFSNMTDYRLQVCMQRPEACFFGMSGAYVTNVTTVTCGEVTNLGSVNQWVQFHAKTSAVPSTKAETTTIPLPDKKSRKRREDPKVPSEGTDIKDVQSNPSNVDTASDKVTEAPKKQTTTTPLAPKTSIHCVATTPFIGEYLVIVGIEESVGGTDLHVDVSIEMEGPQGYLSAHEFPLLTFYEIMCVVYVFYAVAWLVMSACNYHDLLRVQFWIGGVILLGLIEKAVHYSEYSTVDSSGISDTGTEKFAEVVSAFKRAVARMLVIIVSLGFGIVKPRLGPMLHRVVGIGILYFVVAVVEAMMRIDVYFDTTRKAWIFMYVPLAVLDSIICCWVFMSLLQTMKTLRLRRNITKLSLYRHFANTILFCVLISIGMMVWSIYYQEQGCVVDFSNVWFETACWPMLFSIILLVIMILWRPNANNQRYAYSPMIDGNDSDDDDAEEPMLGSGATETVKMRSTGKKSVVRSEVDRTDEDLKWIEENIPQTVADAALPALMDSDEEVMTTKYEMNKME